MEEIEKSASENNLYMVSVSIIVLFISTVIFLAAIGKSIGIRYAYTSVLVFIFQVLYKYRGGSLWSGCCVIL